MLPESPVRAKHKKVRLIFGAVTSCSVAAFALLIGPHSDQTTFIALGCTVVGNAVVLVVGWPTTDGFLLPERRRRHGRSGGPVARVVDHAGGPATAGGRPVLRTLARMMPCAAGRRWLAEADSLLFELSPERRGPALRSYLRSAPRLIVIMWVSQLSRRARPRLRVSTGAHWRAPPALAGRPGRRQPHTARPSGRTRS